MMGEMNPRILALRGSIAYLEMRLSTNTARAGSFNTTPIPWDVVAIDSQGLWEPSSNMVRVKKSGIYIVSSSILILTNVTGYVTLHKSSLPFVVTSDAISSFKGGSTPIYLKAGDGVYSTLECSAATTMRSDFSNFTLAGPLGG
jgi:hypothetical protein